MQMVPRFDAPLALCLKSGVRFFSVGIAPAALEDFTAILAGQVAGEFHHRGQVGSQQSQNQTGQSG